jgi:hypothetical protein
MNSCANIILTNAQPLPVERFGAGPRDLVIGGGKVLRIGRDYSSFRNGI